MTDDRKQSEARSDFEQRISDRLRASVGDLRADEAAHLAAARRAAVATLDEPARRSTGWLPLSAAATALIAVALVMLMRDPATDAPLAVDSAGDDVEILMAEEDLDLIEDLEFYLWLAASDETS